MSKPALPWTDLITRHTESTYRATLGLAHLVADDEFAWRPATGDNGMSVGQLLEHLTNAGGAGVKGFVTGNGTAVRTARTTTAPRPVSRPPRRCRVQGPSSTR